VRRPRGRAIFGSAVSLGTAGLTSCITGCSGGVDPPPPPPRCENLNAQRDLRPSVVAGEGGTLIVRIDYVGTEATSLTDPRVSSVGGARLVAVRLEGAPPQVVIELLPDTPAPPRVSFALDGFFAGYPAACAFQRAFTITFEGGISIAESRLALPFAAQPRATIVVAGRDGRCVTLRAVADPPGRHTAWSVSGGTLVPEAGERILWQLPPEPGLYQAELFVDHGENGFAFDTLALEVHA
jgi:hypothetical protein